MKTDNLLISLFFQGLGKKVPGTILAGSLGNAPGQNKVLVAIFPSAFWRRLLTVVKCQLR